MIFKPTIYAGGAGDNPDKRDYVKAAPYRKLRAKTEHLKRAYGQGFKVKDQTVNKFTHNACSAFSESHGNELNNILLDDVYTEINAELQWSRQLSTGGDLRKGDYIQNAKKQYDNFPQVHPITEYIRIRDEKLQEIQRWMANNHTIQTVIYWKRLSNGKSNYSEMFRTGVYKWEPTKTLGAHAITLVDYDISGQVLIGADSLNNKYGTNKKGEIIIPFEFAEKLGSCLVSRDAIG